MIADLFTRARITASLCAVGVALLAAGLPASASNTFPGTNGKIAVVKYDKAGSPTIGIVTKGRKVRSLFKPSPIDGGMSDPSFSRNGKQIALTDYVGGSTNRILQVVKVATGKVRTIGTGSVNVNYPAFLADGRIVFSGAHRSNGSNPGTYVVDSNGAHRHRLFGQQELAASAHGNWFVATDVAGNFHTLFLLDSEGNRVRKLTRDPSVRYLSPEFSPNGKWVAYEREIEHPGVLRHRSDVFIVRRDGTHRRRLTSGSHASQPTFSPDGRWIAFRRTYGNGGGGNIIALSVRNPGKRRVLTRVPGAQFQDPTWARG